MAPRITLNPEDSAQGSTARPNPLVRASIDMILRGDFDGAGFRRVADQGAGRLRHLNVMARAFEFLCVVDTDVQLQRVQKLFGGRWSVLDVINTPRRGWGA